MHEGFFIGHIYTEIFIVTLNLGKHQQIEIYNEFSNVIELLNSRSISRSKDIKVIHGYLLPATIIPNNLGGVGTFILIDLPNTNYGLFTGHVFYNPDKLAMAVQAVLSHKYNKIENVFILYGTKISLTLSIAIDEIDEELIGRSSLIAKKVKQAEIKLKINKIGGVLCQKI